MQWWGHKHGFISGGFLGAQSSSKSSKSRPAANTSDERTAFAEKDQENLYNLVQVAIPFVLLVYKVEHMFS